MMRKGSLKYKSGRYETKSNELMLHATLPAGKIVWTADLSLTISGNKMTLI